MSYQLYHSSDTQFDFDESDNVWINPTDTYQEPNKSTPPTSNSRRPAMIKKPFPKKSTDTAGRSLPVNIPARDWRKMKKPATEENFDDDDEDEGINMGLAPHEYLARTRVASLSVHEGIGRTLKGRDLSRVRDAIWKQTGFED